MGITDEFNCALGDHDWVPTFYLDDGTVVTGSIVDRIAMASCEACSEIGRTGRLHHQSRRYRLTDPDDPLGAFPDWCHTCATCGQVWEEDIP